MEVDLQGDPISYISLLVRYLQKCETETQAVELLDLSMQYLHTVEDPNSDESVELITSLFYNFFRFNVRNRGLLLRLFLLRETLNCADIVSPIRSVCIRMEEHWAVDYLTYFLQCAEMVEFDIRPYLEGFSLTCGTTIKFHVLETLVCLSDFRTANIVLKYGIDMLRLFSEDESKELRLQGPGSCTCHPTGLIASLKISIALFNVIYRTYCVCVGDPSTLLIQEYCSGLQQFLRDFLKTVNVCPPTFQDFRDTILCPTVQSVLVDNTCTDEIFEWFETLLPELCVNSEKVPTPMSLMHQSRCATRDMLQNKFALSHINTLEIPSTLKDYLKLRTNE